MNNNYFTLSNGKFAFFLDGYKAHSVNFEKLEIKFEYPKSNIFLNFDDEEDAIEAAAELSDAVVEYLKSHIQSMDAVDFLNWTLSTNCTYQCIAVDKWVLMGGTDNKTIATSQIYEIYRIWKKRQ